MDADALTRGESLYFLHVFDDGEIDLHAKWPKCFFAVLTASECERTYSIFTYLDIINYFGSI